MEPFILIGSTQANAFIGNADYCCTLTEAMGKGGGQIHMIGSISVYGETVSVTEEMALDEQNKYVRKDGCIGTIMTDGSSPKHNNRVLQPDLRIRKLTPKECFRLMGFDDADVDLLIENGISNTQLYKMAGNSIVVNMLEFLFCQIFDNNNEIWV